MKSIEQVKKETADRLVAMGYNPDTVNKVVRTFWKVIAWRDEEPTKVLTVDGQEIYL